MYLPRKFPLFFTDELRLDETDLFIFRDRFANDLSYFFIIIARRRETEEHPSARAPSFSLSLSLKSSDTKTKRNEKRAQLNQYFFFSSSAIVPTTPSERSQTLEPNFSSSSLDAEKPKNTRARAHLLFYISLKSPDTKTKRNEKRAQNRGRPFYLPRSFRRRLRNDLRRLIDIHHHRSNNAAETQKTKRPPPPPPPPPPASRLR